MIGYIRSKRKIHMFNKTGFNYQKLYIIQDYMIILKIYVDLSFHE